MDISLLWIPATLAAAAAQTARNATQRRVTETLGTVGATQVRFLYGLPFAALFLLIVLAVSGERLPGPGSGFFGFIVMGAVTQILATALMLAAMRERSFSVVTATTKTRNAIPRARVRRRRGSSKAWPSTCRAVAPNQTMKLALCKPTTVPLV